jgi:hypothetical protein
MSSFVPESCASYVQLILPREGSQDSSTCPRADWRRAVQVGVCRLHCHFSSEGHCCSDLGLLAGQPLITMSGMAGWHQRQ